MTAAVLCVGTELVRGEIVNTNATWLCEQLTALRHEVVETLAVADDEKEIIAALTRLGQRYDLVISTGGLGPTTDDITSACVAKLLSVPLVRDEAGVAALKQRFVQAGRTFYESNIKQLDFPQGAHPLPNEVGTAPGFSVTIGKALAFFVPGVPAEMKPMFECSIRPQLASLVQGGEHQVRLKTFGMAEAAVGELLTGVEEQFAVTLGYRAHFPEIEVKVLARDASQSSAEERANGAARVVRERLGQIVFAEGDVTLAQSVGRLLSARGLTLGLAESCTGGLISHLVCERPASDYFLGSVVCYANQIKEQVLGVNPDLLRDKGAVSAEVAEQMALGARRVLGADVGLAVTGIAGPSGGSSEKPVGLVHYAVATPAGVMLSQTQFPRSRDQVRLHAAYSALMLVRRALG
ncbi:MAG TPA: competence/damage-inducible protein A [Polyangiaceae bacterium]|nr:competence/damage-inducible protein A [Polyangiaceae bacterium]